MGQIPIEQVKLNMVLSQDVVNSAGSVLIKRWTVLADQHISQLRKQNIKQLFVEDQDSLWAKQLVEIDQRLDDRFQPYLKIPFMSGLKKAAKDYLKDKIKPL